MRVPTMLEASHSGAGTMHMADTLEARAAARGRRVAHMRVPLLAHAPMEICGREGVL